MKTYYVTFEIFASTTVQVEADSEDEAREKACKKAGGVSLCHQCSRVVSIDDVGEITNVSEATE